jgi:alkylation response protein AidB-like acyl-CoA dehydrogenase
MIGTPIRDCILEGAVDFTLSEEHKRWRAVAQEFAEQVIKPDALRRDRLLTAAERIPWDWIREADKLGIRTLGVPKKYGGAGADILSDAMTPEQQEKFIPAFVKDPEATFAIGFTEVGAGSDHQGYYDSPDIAFHTTAVRDGDSYVINGAKRYVSNGCMAKL